MTVEAVRAREEKKNEFLKVNVFSTNQQARDTATLWFTEPNRNGKESSGGQQRRLVVYTYFF